MKTRLAGSIDVGSFYSRLILSLPDLKFHSVISPTLVAVEKSNAIGVLECRCLPLLPGVSLKLCVWKALKVSRKPGAQVPSYCLVDEQIWRTVHCPIGTTETDIFEGAGELFPTIDRRLDLRHM